MHALTHRLAAALSGVALTAATLAAQNAGARPTFGLSAGAVIPTGDFGDVVSTGYTIGAHLGFRGTTLPVGFRLEGAFQQNDAKGTNPSNARISAISGTANVIAGAAAAPGSFRPYVIGGAGVYNLRFASDVLDTESSTKFGLNGGAGIDLPLSGISVFAEARFHYVFADESGVGYNMSFIPVTVGIRF